MTDLDVQQRLTAALSELPGGPIAAPVGLGERALRHERRRRRLVVSVCGFTVLALAGGLLFAIGSGGLAESPDVPADASPPAVRPTPLSLEGTREEPRPFKQLALRPGQVPPTITATDIIPLEDDQASIPWNFHGTLEDDRILSLSYNPSCNSTAQVQVAESSGYVLVQVVRTGPPSSLLCLTLGRGEVTLGAPIGARKLLHAATREVLPSKPLSRRPDLPGGVSDLPDTPGHATTYDLGDGQVLACVTGRRRALGKCQLFARGTWQR